MSTLRSKQTNRIKWINTPSTLTTTRKSSEFRTRRVITEHNDHPIVSQFQIQNKKQNERMLPQNFIQYVKAKRDVEHAFMLQKRRSKIRKINEIPLDINTAYTILSQAETGIKFLHKSSFEESITSPYTKKKLDQINEEFSLQPIKPEIKLEQESLGEAIITNDWEKRWEQLFEAFFEIQTFKSKGLNQLNGQRKDSQVKYHRLNNNNNNNQVQNNFLTHNNVQLIKKELQKPAQQRDIQIIDELFKKNKFFKRFNEMIRKIIIYECTLKEFTMDELVLSTSFNNNKVFVILKGSCKVIMTSFNKNGNILGKMPIRSIYEGYHINVSNLLIEKKISDLKEMENFFEVNLQQYVKSEIYAQENSILIEIGQEIYENLLIQTIDDQMKEKIELLKQIKIIGLNKDLKPLAGILEVQQFKFGDVILQVGQEINHLYFIKSGRVKVSICEREQRELYNHFIKQEQPDLYNISYDSNEIDTKKNIEHCQQKLIRRQKQSSLIEANIHIDIKYLNIGEFFGGSSLMTNNEIMKINQYKKNKIAQIELIAVTPDVELYTIDCMEFETIPDSFQHQLKELILTQSEYDDYDVTTIKNQYHQWSILKQAYYKSFAKK